MLTLSPGRLLCTSQDARTEIATQSSQTETQPSKHHRPSRSNDRGGGGGLEDPAMTDFRARGTIMGLAGLTAVFGMGTGGAPPVSSPESGRGAVKPPGRGGSDGRSHAQAHRCESWRWRFIPDADPRRIGGRLMGSREHRSIRAPSGVAGGGGSGWSSGRLLGPVGCDGRPSCTPGLSTWSSSRSLRRINPTGNLVLKRASRLDAFSAYPFPTWLPGDAPSGTAGTPEVGPPQSSRTRGDPSQVSDAHGR